MFVFTAEVRVIKLRNEVYYGRRQGWVCAGMPKWSISTNRVGSARTSQTTSLSHHHPPHPLDRDMWMVSINVSINQTSKRFRKLLKKSSNRFQLAELLPSPWTRLRMAQLVTNALLRYCLSLVPGVMWTRLKGHIVLLPLTQYAWDTRDLRVTPRHSPYVEAAVIRVMGRGSGQTYTHKTLPPCGIHGPTEIWISSLWGYREMDGWRKR